MATLTQIRDVLDAPKRAQELLRLNTAKRLQALLHAERVLAARETACSVREHVFRRALDSGAHRPSEIALLRWVNDELLPSLPPCQSVVSMTAEMEDRAAELDAQLIELQERELVLRHEKEMLHLRATEVRVREEEVERRVRDSADLASKIEAQLDYRSKHHEQNRAAIAAALRACQTRLLDEEERRERCDFEARRGEWLAARVADINLLRRSADAELRDLNTLRGVVSRWRRKPPSPPPQGVSAAFPMMSDATPESLFPTVTVDVSVSVTSLVAPTVHVATNTPANAVVEQPVRSVVARSAMSSIAVQTEGQGDAPKTPQTSAPHATSTSGQLPWESPQPVVIVVPAFDDTGDLFDADQDERERVSRIEYGRREAMIRQREATVAVKEAEVKGLMEYATAQRKEADDLSAQVLRRARKLVEAELRARERRAGDPSLAGEMLEPADAAHHDRGYDDEGGREAFAVHPLLNFVARGRPIAQHPGYLE